MKMNELERRTGVGRETIRFYIRAGLLPEPQRRARNVAVYSDVHVQRLRTIRRLKEERFLPLDIIRRILMGDPTALPATADPFGELAPLLAARLGVGVDEPPVELQTLIAADPLAAQDVRDMCELGTISVRDEDGTAVVSRLDARIIALWRDIRRAGYDPAAFPVEYIRLYMDALRPMAAEEVARFFAGFEGRIDQGDAAGKAQAGVEIINALIAALRTRFLLEEVAQRTLNSSPPPSPAS
jgi:DNA-binding transcriptional MerR regulator